MAKPLDKETVKAEAAGRWREVFEALGIDLDPRLYRNPGESLSEACPICGGRFWLSKKGWTAAGATCCATCGPRGDGIELVIDYHQISFPGAIDAVATALGLSESSPTPFAARQAPAPCQPAFDPAPARKALRAAHKEAVPVRRAEPSLVNQYLASRGLHMTDDALHDLYFAPRLKHYATDDDAGNPLSQPMTTYWPGMLAVVRDSVGNPVTSHRTYLTPEGTKAPVIDGCAKKLMAAIVPSITGSAIRLTGTLIGDTLNLAEGIETALAVFALLGFDSNVWSCISAPLLAGFEPPAGVRRLVVWADKDRSRAGEEAAEKLAERMAERGIDVEIRLPSLEIPAGAKSVDWLDAWNAGYRLETVEIERAA